MSTRVMRPAGCLVIYSLHHVVLCAGSPRATPEDPGLTLERQDWHVGVELLLDRDIPHGHLGRLPQLGVAIRRDEGWNLDTRTGRPGLEPYRSPRATWLAASFPLQIGRIASPVQPY